ncbi:unnamed protein product [Coccothraustes coccothraustes]
MVRERCGAVRERRRAEDQQRERKSAEIPPGSRGIEGSGYAGVRRSVKLLSCESFALDLRNQPGVQSRMCSEMLEGCR